MKKQVTILTGEPTIEAIAEMSIDWEGVRGMARWVKSHRPECLPEEYDPDREDRDTLVDETLFPHDCRRVGGMSSRITDNELLVELAGRKCYDSFGLKAGKKSNAEYIANTQMGEIPHASILYHAKLCFFIAGVSRRVSHELIRNYVGADRDEEGSPSQESTRFTHHYGFYVAPPRDVEAEPPDALTAGTIGSIGGELEAFQRDMQTNYDSYLGYVERQFALFERTRGEPCKGMDRKRIYEAASARLSHACETSFIWTTNPMALRKLFRERCDVAADLEFQRFAKKWRRICLERAPNLFPGISP